MDLTTNQADVWIGHIEWIIGDQLYSYLTDNTALNNLYDELKIHLNPFEQVKFKSFKNRKSALLYLISHIYLQVCLNELIDQNDYPIEFSFTKYGKPFLKGKQIFFNLSHSWPYFALIITKCCKCGIDIETVNPELNVNEILSFFHFKEQHKIRESLNCHELFYWYWTAKEAHVKRLGLGLNLDFNQFYYDCKIGVVKNIVDTYTSSKIKTISLPNIFNTKKIKNAYCSIAYDIIESVLVNYHQVSKLKNLKFLSH